MDLSGVVIPEAQAHAAAKAAGAIWDGGDVYVGRLSGFGVADRLVWVFRYTGLSVEGGDPGAGSPPPSCNVAFYYVDAQSGAVLGDTLVTE